MRHKLKGRKLSRTSAHRKATMRALTMALVREHKIITTVAKAKELRSFVEPLITRSKKDNLLNRRMVFSYLQNKETVKKLFEEIAPKSKDRPGGYTRVIKTGFRQGDGADMAVIELVDYNDIKPESCKAVKKKRTRRTKKSTTKTVTDSQLTSTNDEKSLIDESEVIASEMHSASEDNEAELKSE